VSNSNETQTGWDAEARIARVQRIERQMRLIDQIEREIREAELKVKCLRRNRQEAKWELDRLMVNLAVLAPPPPTADQAPAPEADQVPAPSRSAPRRKRKEVE
jgi:hypothetical protein